MPALKIATLIPAFRTDFLEDTLKCLGRQSYRNFDCYLADDSAELEVITLTESLRERDFFNFHLEVLPGPRVGLSLANIRMLLSRIKGRYDLIHLFFDDDLLESDFYATHINLHRHGNIRVSASARSIVDSAGVPVGRGNLPEKVGRSSKKQMLITDRYVANTMIPTINNWVGEYSNMVFASDCADYFGMTGWNGLHYGLGDVSCAIFAGSELAYTSEVLGSFRMHDKSLTADINNPSRKCSLLAWCQIASDALDRGLISEDCARACIRTVCSLNANLYSGASEMMRFQKILDDMLLDRHLNFSKFTIEWKNYFRDNFAFLEI